MPSRNEKSIIDYVVFKQNTKLKTKDISVVHGAESESEHFVARARINVRYKFSRTNNKKRKRDAMRSVKYHYN